ncbi:MAG: AAA family ATPase, partial [Actinomycetota bacterium]|nr:AAA family ATPase [Actinomycetota bacterium]
AELALAGRMGRELALRKALAPLLDDWDVVLVDCPPNLGLLAVCGLVAADHAILSTEAQYFALQGVEQALEVIELARDGLNPDLGWLGVVFNIADMRTRHSRDAYSSLREHVGRKPTFGICLGHQLLCRAVGLETFKLPFGHRGSNHPVKDLTTGRIEITSQNHGFAVLGPDGARTMDTDDPVRWETDFGAAELTHLNLYDRTVEGLTLLDVPGSTVQYHPEAGPGPHDALYLFDRFLDAIRAAA